MEKVLHYIHDPLCGWCYGASALTEAAASLAPGQFEIRLHAGGLFQSTRLSDANRAHIRSADTRIGEITGQVFGQAYLNGLLGDPATVYDSSQPIRGILAADAIKPGSGLAMLKALQRAHYQSGLRIVEMRTIVKVAEAIGLDAMQFTRAFETVGANELTEHLKSTHELMRKVGVQGYPAFVAQVGSYYERLPHDRFYGNADAFADQVAHLLITKRDADVPE